MWTICPVLLDKAVTIPLFGIDLYDAMILTAMPLVLFSLCDALVSFGVPLVLALILSYAERHGPPGALLHWLHGMQLIRLPGVLSPKPQQYSAW